MNKFPLILFLIVSFFVACNWSKLRNKNLSKSNIDFVELTFPRGTNQKTIRLDSSHLELFAKILKNRKEEFVKPSNCYKLYIKLKDGGAVNYLTDGINFQGFDDSSDLPFSFKVQTNILKAAFNLKTIYDCN
jgi:hypothetical protein